MVKHEVRRLADGHLDGGQRAPVPARVHGGDAVDIFPGHRFKGRGELRVDPAYLHLVAVPVDFGEDILADREKDRVRRGPVQHDVVVHGGAVHERHLARRDNGEVAVAPARDIARAVHGPDHEIMDARGDGGNRQAVDVQPPIVLLMRLDDPVIPGLFPLAHQVPRHDGELVPRRGPAYGNPGPVQRRRHLRRFGPVHGDGGFPPFPEVPRRVHGADTVAVRPRRRAGETVRCGLRGADLFALHGHDLVAVDGE